MSKATIKAIIDANIRTNGKGDITGRVLNSVLNAMVEEMDNGNQYMGIANADTIPAAGYSSAFYLATDPGIYTHFGNADVKGISLIRYTSSGWAVDYMGVEDLISDAVSPVQEQVNGKQDKIADLDNIRSGASKGATAYQKPSPGIPKTDLAAAVQSSLTKADTALQSHQPIKTINGGSMVGEGDVELCTKKAWYKLVDYTTTEAVANISFSQGDNGEVFDDYDEIIVVMMLQPTGESVRALALSITSESAWGGQYLSFNGALAPPSSTEKSMMAYAWMQRTPMGIMHKKLGRSSDNSTKNLILASTFCTGGIPQSQTTATKLRSNVVWTPEQFTMPLLPTEFKCVSIGCYTGTPIEANCKFIIYGLK